MLRQWLHNGQAVHGQSRRSFTSRMKTSIAHDRRLASIGGVLAARRSASYLIERIIAVSNVRRIGKHWTRRGSIREPWNPRGCTFSWLLNPRSAGYYYVSTRCNNELQGLKNSNHKLEGEKRRNRNTITRPRLMFKRGGIKRWFVFHSPFTGLD